ncbi:hypothetical protein H3C67_02835 [Candidatus Dojkabacteria bacterium]|uniref:Uncharacterized protein n=1 Tax=Candidatus Dojkabacteria bacterium TaxID=2099670 RepID=A0A952AKH8_9BACT|nr:hypothetical protein [Candidatus Dojkabacteria bacterium]
MNWDHYKIFVSDCSIYDCSTPDLPTDDPGEWDLGTLVTNGSYTIPNPAEGKYLAIYAADDDNGDPVTIGGSYTIIAVKNTPATYNVTDCEELQAISDGHLEDNVYLLNDIDCSETFEWNAGAGFEPIGNNSDQFFGKFFGNGYTISDLTINRPGADYIGLFGVLGDGGELQNFTLDNVNIVGDDSVGAAVGYLGGTMNNVHSSGEIRGYYNIGGLVGEHAEPLGTGSSSVLLYTWDGSDYTYMHDVGRGMPRNVVGDDYVQVDSSKLQPKDRKYSLKMAQEYNEIPFYDEAKLITFDHEPGYNIVTTPIRNNEGNFFSVADNPSHPLQACTDKYGNNCLDDLASDDDKWSYKHDSNINYWNLDFGDLSGASRIMLILRGAIDYTLDADSLRLVQVKNSVGEWVNAYTSSQISSLGGSPRLLAIDLTGKFVSDNYEVRIGYDRTRINYFAVDTSAPVTYEMTELHPETANLGFRGYSEVNREYYWDHNYNNVSDQPLEPYAPQFGWFTKYGDVAQLLSSTNDQFVIMHQGDVIDMEFEYNPVEDGKERSFIFYNWIIYKHAKSGSYGQTVEPLPFKGMSKYPYTSPETYPFTPVNVSYLREWNTRFIQGSFSNNSSTVLNSSSSADVYGEEIVGGLVGYNEKLVDLSFATGNVYAEDSSYSHARGLVGFNDDDGTVSRSYATGNVTGDSDFGGFAGYFGGYEDEVIEFSFWDIQTADVTDACGNTDCESDAVAKNTTEMKALATFTTELGANSWDFEDIWAINAAYNDSYPFFIWAIPQDSDNDGILDQVEDDGPNSGDANNDGTPDSEQEHVSSFYNEVSSAYSVLEAPNTCTISSVTAQAEASLSVSDSGYSYPAGLLNFTIDCGTPGFTAEIKIYHYGELGSDFVLRKHNTNNNSFTTISEATFSQATIDGQPVNVVTYSITDGSSLDLDDELNGIIVDPVGYGISDLGAPVTGFGGRHNR